MDRIRVVPRIFCRSDVAFADRLFASRGSDSPRLPELMALIAMPGIDRAQQAAWVHTLFGQNMSDGCAAALAAVVGRLGVFAFSFPTWRFLADHVRSPGGRRAPALLEEFGMTPLSRTTDRRDEGDWLGTGFVSDQLTSALTDAVVEYRRAYVRVSFPDQGGHLLIRNSSYYWGRSNFLHAAYYSPERIPEEAMRNLTPSAVDNGGLLAPFPSEVWQGHTARLVMLVETLVAFNDRLSDWFFDGEKIREGFGPLIANLFLRVAHDRPPVLGFISREAPPWCPHAVLPVSRETLRAIADHGTQQSDFFQKGIEHHARLVLLSGTRGDFPSR